jgi:hypothetical protein
VQVFPAGGLDAVLNKLDRVRRLVLDLKLPLIEASVTTKSDP